MLSMNCHSFMLVEHEFQGSEKQFLDIAHAE